MHEAHPIGGGARRCGGKPEQPVENAVVEKGASARLVTPRRGPAGEQGVPKLGGGRGDIAGLEGGGGRSGAGIHQGWELAAATAATWVGGTPDYPEPAGLGNPDG